MREKRTRTIVAQVVLALLFTGRVLGDAYDPPGNYYSTATGTGATLKSQLNSIIDGHTVISYDGARTALQRTDLVIGTTRTIWLVYNRAQLDLDTVIPSGSIPGWDNGVSWNREHTWPDSRLGSSGAPRSDLFNLRPSDNGVNSDRANTDFGAAYGQTFGEKMDGGLVWYPGNADAGIIARQEFYMDVRYDGADSGTSDLQLVNGNPADSSTTLGNLSRMIEWNYAAPPEEFERRRNEIIYDDYQHNRNPFIDRPEYAWSVFMNQTNDSSIGIQGGTVGVAGATSLDLNLGRTIVGGSLPLNQAVVLNKSGLNGTYYQIATAGSVDDVIAGRYNAFRTNTIDTRSLSVGLSTSTNTTTPGLRTGTVTIDNLDVTTSGGAGKGANDGNDVINVSLSVLNHANPSFSGDSDLNSLAYDFGVITVGGPAPTFSFDIFNYFDPPTTAGFTAGLDLDSIASNGQTGAFNTNLVTFNGADTLAAGLSNSFTASLNTLAPGDFSATYTLTFSDENLSGAIGAGQMTFSLSGQVVAVPTEDADFDGDGDIDGADFLTWQRGVGLPSGASPEDGDADGDSGVDADDLAIWSSQYGAASGTASQTIPEPATIILTVIAASLYSLAFRRRTS